MIEVGKELEFIRSRLRDIAYIAENSKPVNDGDWRDYARSMNTIIAKNAHQALTALHLHEAALKTR